LREVARLGRLDERLPPIPREAIERSKLDEARRRKRRIATASEIWEESRGPIRDTPADCYLRQRGIDHLSPFIDPAAVEVLRFHPRCWHSPGVHRPALVAKVEHIEHGFLGVSATYLALDGSGKTTLEPPRRFFGCVKGGAVRFGDPRPGKWLALAEGIETTLSVAQSGALAAWACLSADGIRSIVLPSTALLVVICGDRDENAVGERAARDAGARFVREGRRVRIALPPEPGTDFNDILCGMAAVRGERVLHASA
jgi:hypothetical protein